MTKKNSFDYAIALFPDENFCRWAESNRSGMAKNFPVHLTIKTRFSIDSVPSFMNVLSSLEKKLGQHTEFAAALNGPFYIDKRIRWLECQKGDEGYDEIIGLHNVCQEIISQPGVYERSAFRPHITLSWNDTGIVVPDKKFINEKISAYLRFEAWGILRYTQDKLRRGVNVVHISSFH